MAMRPPPTATITSSTAASPSPTAYSMLAHPPCTYVAKLPIDVSDRLRRRADAKVRKTAARAGPQRLLAGKGDLAVDEGGVEVVARRAVAMRAELDGRSE